jgi:spore germination cell wall hydrolase CwlJ-like protein
MAIAVYFEARSEPIDGQRAVAEVIMNRVADGRYPDTVCGVVFEDRQFSFTHDGNSLTMRPSKAKDIAIEVAKSVLESPDDSITSTHYHADYVNPYWSKAYDREFTIGRHIFYTNNTPNR